MNKLKIKLSAQRKISETYGKLFVRGSFENILKKLLFQPDFRLVKKDQPNKLILFSITLICSRLNKFFIIIFKIPNLGTGLSQTNTVFSYCDITNLVFNPPFERLSFLSRALKNHY